MRKDLLIIAFFFVLTGRAFTADWVPVGPPAATLASIVPDRKDPLLWYTTQNNMLYRSTDGTRSWYPTAEASGGLYVSPADSSVFVGRYEKEETGYVQVIYKSSDRGINFQRLGIWPDTDNPLRFSRTDARFLYRADRDFYWESADEGRTWITKKPLLHFAIDLPGCSATRFQIYDIVASPLSADKLSLSIRLSGCSAPPHRVAYAAIAESNDRGTNWYITLANTPTPQQYNFGSFRFLDDPASQTIWALGREGTVASWNGISWHADANIPCPVGATCNTLRQVQLFHPQDNLVVAQHINIVNPFKHGCRALSRTDGRWREAPEYSALCNTDGYNSVQGITNSLGDLVFVTEALGFRRIKNGKLYDANFGLPNTMSLNNPQVVGNRVYAIAGTTNLSLLYKSNDGGENWTELHTPLHGDAQITRIAISPHNADILLLHLRILPRIDSFNNKFIQYIFRTVDGGQSWTRCLEKYETYSRTPMRFDPLNEGIVYFGLGSSLYRSAHNGISPIQVSSAKGYWIEDVAVDPFVPGRLYATTCTNVLRSDDSGASFIEVSTGIHRLYEGCNAVFIAALPQRNHYLLQNDIDEMMLTEDAGVNWRRISQVPTRRGGGSYRPPGARRFYARSASTIFALTRAGTYKSIDGGRSWKQQISYYRGTDAYDMSDPSLGPLYLVFGTLLKEVQR